MENILRYLLSSNHYHGMPWKSNSNRSAKTWKQLSMFEERNFHFMFVLKFWCRKEAAQLSQIPQFSQPPAVWKAIDLTSALRPSLTTGSFCFLSIFLPGTWLLLNSKRRQAVYVSCEILQATEACWGRGGKAPRCSFVCIRESSVVERRLSWCWSSPSTKNKTANTFIADQLPQAQCPLHYGSGTFRRRRFCKLLVTYQPLNPCSPYFPF